MGKCCDRSYDNPVPCQFTENYMSEYKVTISWQRAEGEDFVKSAYSRGHEWKFDGGAVVPASSSPHIVPLPYSVEANVDPEEAFVASLSSCHMLFFLSIAAKRRLSVESYVDEASGIMEQNVEQRLAMTRVILRPRVSFAGDKHPSREQLEKMHDQAHHQCFIANSVLTEVITEIPE
ncbi:MAG: organic hydroperoxide reductase OsmC/OhrA [Planctomycetota bacterium]|jgi:organic hydroperoxide reductase OsmC/OhrA